MPKYREKDYSVENALYNIGDYFWKRYYEDLKTYVQNPWRKDIVERIHEDWDRNGMSPYGTDIRIEWAVQIYEHGDWEKAIRIKQR